MCSNRWVLDLLFSCIPWFTVLPSPVLYVSGFAPFLQLNETVVLTLSRPSASTGR